jgi:hypothetical protein
MVAVVVAFYTMTSPPIYSRQGALAAIVELKLLFEVQPSSVIPTARKVK